MSRKSIIRTTLIAAAVAAFALPNAFAQSEPDDFWKPLNATDVGGDIFPNLPERPKVPATPEQAANLRYLEAQRQITDGSNDNFANAPDRVIVPATPEQQANLRFLECQRQISDGSGHTCGSREAPPAVASDVRSLHAEASARSGDRMQ